MAGDTYSATARVQEAPPLGSTSLGLIAGAIPLYPDPPQGRRQRPSLAPRWVLTQAGHGEHAGGRGGGDAVGEHGLQYVVGEGHGDDSQAGGVHDEDRTPEQQEAETSEGPSGTGIWSIAFLAEQAQVCGGGCTLGPGAPGLVLVLVLEAGFGPGRQVSTDCMQQLNSCALPLGRR